MGHPCFFERSFESAHGNAARWAAQGAGGRAAGVEGEWPRALVQQGSSGRGERAVRRRGRAGGGDPHRVVARGPTNPGHGGGLYQGARRVVPGCGGMGRAGRRACRGERGRGASGGAVGAPTRVGSCSGRVPRNRLRVSSRKASEMRMRMAAATSAAGFSSRGEPPPTTPAREKAPLPPRAPAPVRGGAGGAARDLASSLPLPARDGQCEGECRAAHGRGDPRGGGGGARGGRRGAVHALHDLRAARLPGRAAAARLRAGRGVGRAGPERRGADEAVPGAARRRAARLVARVRPAGLRRDRGPPLLRARRRRLGARAGRGVGERACGRHRRRVQHDHDAARAEPVPGPAAGARADAGPQAGRDPRRALDRADVRQARDPGAVRQPDLFRERRLGRGGGRAGVFRQAGRGADAGGGRDCSRGSSSRRRG